MDDALLRGDCARCAGLCCVALAFDRSALFAFDKRAGEVCRHLGAEDRCRIHQELATRGLAGCARYDCLGAGQLVVQDCFGGRSWRDSPELLRPMLEAFAAMREVQELRQLLREAGRLGLTRERQETREMLQAALEPESGWSLEALGGVARSALPERIREFLASLRPSVPAAGRVVRPAAAV